MIQLNIVRAYSFDYKFLAGQKISGELNISNVHKKIYSEYLQWPVGYEIQNIGQEPIKDVIYPKYKLIDNYYIGEEHKKDLLPNEYIILPTRYIILLLIQNGSNLEMENGVFVPLYKKLETTDTNILLSNYYFKPYKEFYNFLYEISGEDSCNYYSLLKDEKFEDGIYPQFYRKMGNIDRDYFFDELNKSKYKKNLFSQYDVHIIEPELLSLFGNLENKYNRKKIEIDITNSKSVLFLKNLIRG